MTIACPDCGTLQSIPPLPQRAVAKCRVCDLPLERTAGRSLDAALAYAVTTLILLFPANILPMMAVSLAGATRQSVLGSGVWILWQQDWPLVAAQIGAFVLVIPFVRFGLLTSVLALLRLGYRPHWLGRAFRWSSTLEPWAMLDVFLIGFAVGYSRVVAFLPVHIGAGGWCLAAAAFLSMATTATLDTRRVWRRIAPESDMPTGPSLSCRSCDLVLPATSAGGRCPRCRGRVSTRVGDSLIRTTALIVAAALLYGPANVFSMTNAYRLQSVQHHTIFNGILQLIHAQLWPLAVLIFFTSISIPLLKLMGLAWLVISVRLRKQERILGRTKLHRFIDKIGRWSNVDVFTVAVFAPLMQFDGFVSVQAGRGVDAFLLVVVLTMLASNTFDPRLMWDVTRGKHDRGR